jgi:hypothetical protein
MAAAPPINTKEHVMGDKSPKNVSKQKKQTETKKAPKSK